MTAAAEGHQVGVTTTCLSSYVRRMGTPSANYKSVVGDGLLNDLEPRILLAEVESIVNNRPITAALDDSADFTAL